MRWAILVVLAVLGLASEAAAQGPSITVSLDGNSQVLPLSSSIPATSPPHPPGSRIYFYKAIVGGVLWQVNVGAAASLNEMQFQVRSAKDSGIMAGSSFVPSSGGTTKITSAIDGAKQLLGLQVTITP